MVDISMSEILEFQSAIQFFNKNIQDLGDNPDPEKFQHYAGLVKLAEGMLELGRRLRDVQKI